VFEVLADTTEGRISVPVTAPADRRFLRAQVKPGRRQPPWRPWLRLVRGVLLCGLVTWGGWWGAAWILRSPVLRVDRVSVSGTQHLSVEEVLALVDGLRGQHILLVRLEDWRRRVLACPWVADATLRRSFPGTVEVQVTERHPLAIGRDGDQLFLVDEHGEVIDRYGPRYADFDLPIVDGLVPGRPHEAGANERRASLASRLLRDVRTRPDLARRISQLDVSDPRNAVVIVDHDTARVRLGDERFVERLQSYVDLASELHLRVPAVDYVDLRFGERVFVGSQAGVAAAHPTGAARRPDTTQ
jgi:cell division protein FtsQ